LRKQGEGAYEGKSGKEVDVIEAAPFFWCAIGDSLDGSEGPMVYDETINLGEGF
jgi:hypothetical protein